ncbi:tetrahydromethanopterin S-methyltransferase subunit F [Methanobrevibacter sp. 87.7]|uniref:tetrahydromethanopterin S-methyltransferase subunit F n=1 Tax=Methanobrevibacter sp. 87.7 TaxID=387957 RepID=UPI000B506BDC|nr:tetrahydromethanopterin S-methyltransferase subunit F [Methanobrevibacter sp. 87.7]OWT33235.1 tetrahydromethanopterin S-methyltransferase subunit F [Methanobrevibacter sp. 87.7]
MVKISTNPNVRGINNVSENINYKSKLIGRQGRIFSALSASRVKGMGIGIAFAFILIVLLPYIAKLCGL